MSKSIDVLATLRKIADGEGDVELLALRVHGATAELIAAAQETQEDARVLGMEIPRLDAALAAVQANSHGAGETP